MDNNDLKVLPAAEEMLAALWQRAMDNDATLQEIRAIRAGCVALATARHGIEKVGLFPGWDA